MANLTEIQKFGLDCNNHLPFEFVCVQIKVRQDQNF